MLNKAELRKKYIEQRNSITDANREIVSRVICEAIAKLPEYNSAKMVMLYKSIRKEVDLSFIEKSAKDVGKIVIYPLCKKDGIMLAVEPEEGEFAWKKGPFGIQEPSEVEGKSVPAEEIDLIVCPLVSFDEKCNRLGMGGGYYDRFLPTATNAVIIGVAFENQKAYEIPTDIHDIPMDAVITEKEIYRKIP